MSARLLLEGFAKSVLVHRHAFISSPARTLEIGRTADFPASFDEAFGAPAPRAVDAAIEAERWPAALKELERWARREPGLAEPLVIAGVLRLWAAPGEPARKERLEALIDRYAAAPGLRALDDAVRGSRGGAAARLWRALAAMRRVDLPRARRDLDAVIAARPDWAWPVLIRSELARVDITFNDSLRDLNAAERLEPRNAWVHAFRARVLFQKSPGAPALAAMDRAVKLAPRAGWIRAWRGDARRKLGALRGASADLEAAIKLEPSYDRSYLWLGKVLRAQKNPRAAERALTRGLQTCPHFEKAFAERARARLSLGQIGRAHV